MLSLQQLHEHLARVDAAPLRERRKMGRSLGHMAMKMEQAGTLDSVGAMDTAIRALAIGAGVHSFPQRYHMSRARLMLRRREKLGLPEPVIASEKARTLDVEAGALFVVDRDMPADQFVENEPFHVTMNRKGFFSVGLGGDGGVKVRLRIHESGPCEPQSSEFRRLREATQEARVVCPSGAVWVTGCGVKKLVSDVAQREYRAVAYGLGIGRTPECLILLSPIGDNPPDDLTEAPELLL